MGFWGTLAKVGGIAAAPFTGGGSLAATLIPAGLSVAGGVLGGLKGNRTTSTNSIGDPAYTPLRDVLLKNSLDRLNNPSALPGGYIAGGIQNINQNADIGRQSLENALTARGLSNSPAATPALARMETARIGGINQFQNIQAPAFEQQLRQQDFNNALGVMGLQKFNTQTVAPGGAVSGGVSGLLDMLGELYGRGTLGMPKPKYNGPGSDSFGDFLKGLPGIG
jgi:hypothetical protein